MQTTRPIDEMSGSELLDHVDDLSTTQRRCEVQILQAAAQHAILNDRDTLDPDLAKLPGRERAKRFGGVDTPRVAEFACADLGARLGISSWSAHALIADALDLLIRLPQLWARVEALEVKASYARFVARRTRNLTTEQAGYVDARVVESADGRIPWSRFEELVTAAIAAADPIAAAEREEAEAAQQYANPAAQSEHGMRRYYIRARFNVIARLDAVVQYVADALAFFGDTDDNDHRRVKAILILTDPGQALQLLAAYQQHASTQTSQANEDSDPSDAATPAEPEDSPEIDWSRLLPAVQIFVHMYLGTPEQPSEGIARVEGIGAVTEAWVRRQFGDGAQVTIRPVLDIEGLAPVDGHEIPDRHRQGVHLMTPADIFPFAPNTNRGKQVDHTVAYDHGAAAGAGQSRIGNYGPMTPFHHRVKTHGGWDLKQPFPGVYLWRDPHGVIYLVDCTGTRRVGKAA